MEEIKKYSFPTEQELTDNYCKNNFWRCLYDSAADSYHYSIILPNNVKPIEVRPVKSKTMTVIGHYIRVDTSPFLEVYVAYEYCNVEMNVSDWAQKKIYTMGESIINNRIIETKSSGTYIDALTYYKLNEQESFITRITTLKDSFGNGNGANYFMVKARCFEQDYEELAFIILQIVSNWDLTNRSQWPLGDLLQKFSFPAKNQVDFYVPKSWDITFEVDSIKSEAPHFIFNNLTGDHNGVINAFFYQSKDIDNYQDIFEMFFQRFRELEDAKIDLQDFEKVKNDEIKNPVIYSQYRTKGTIVNEKIDFHANIQIEIFRSDRCWYYFDMVGSLPNLQNYFWEENKRCLEIIIKSFNNLDFEEIS